MIKFSQIIKSSSFLLLLLNFFPVLLFAQGKAHNFLIGYDTALFDTNVTSTKAWLHFDQNNFTITPDSFQIAFLSAQGNISDANGNLLLVSNGCWIMNAAGDTMMNGSGLNPGSYTNNWCTSFAGIPYPHSNIILPWPGDTSIYILFHQTGNYSINNSSSSELYYSIVDMTLDNGMGGVIQKNIIAIQDTLNPGMAATKHANGRDWWVIVLKENTDSIYKILVTPQGISSVTTQSLGFTPHTLYNGQPQFSPDGKKFAYRWYVGTWGNVDNWVRLFDFDRCTGNFSNGISIDFWEANPGLGLSFSPSSQYLYVSTLDKIFQINTDTTNVPASLQTVAINDGYCFPYSFTCTDFWVMYLAANGKIYISSGSSVVDLHYINNPNGAGTAGDVQQHALHLPCYSVRGNVYHPNYYLGCDTTLGCSPCYYIPNVTENGGHDFKFNIYPNPSSGNFNIIYLLPQNKEGKLEVFDINGRIVFSYKLPQWSTLQQFNLPQLSQGIYAVKISSYGYNATKKIIITK
jgi:hypothetical protein